MKIGFIGDANSVNSRSWLAGLKAIDQELEIIYWPKEIKRKGLISRAVGILRSVNPLQYWLLEEKPDLIIGYRTTSYGYLAVKSKFRPVVIACQGETDLFGVPFFIAPIKKFFKRYSVKNADLIHAWGANMVPSLLSHGANENKILVLPRGIDLSHFTFPHRRHDLRVNSPLRIIVTRSLSPEYHHDVIIRAASILKKNSIPFLIKFVGDGPSKESLISLTQNLGLSNEIKFIGKVSHDLVKEFLHTSNIYVSMPETEGTSMSLLEAMACGLFPIVTDLPANRNWVQNNVNGFLIELNNQLELATRLQELHQGGNNNINLLKSNRLLVEQKADIRKNMALFLSSYRKLVGANSVQNG